MSTKFAQEITNEKNDLGNIGNKIKISQLKMVAPISKYETKLVFNQTKTSKVFHKLPVKEIVPEKEVNYFTLFLLAAFFPPLAVGIKKSFRSWHFFLTLGLTLSFFVPGMVYATALMFREKRRDR